MQYEYASVKKVSHIFSSLLLCTCVVIILSGSISTAAVSTADPAVSDVNKLLKDAARLLRAELLHDAEAKLRQAEKLAPERIDVKLDLAYVLVKQRRLLEAYEISFPIAEKEPENARALAVLGATFLSGGRFRDARILFFNAVKLNRREHLAWAGFGMLEFYENNIPDSLSNLREAVYHKPDEPDYLFALAQVSARSEQYKEAAEAYNRFLRVSKSTDHDRRERIRGLVSFLRYLGSSGSLYRNLGRDETKIPFDLVGNRPIIEVKVNGRNEPLRFVLDTGSGISVISEETSKRLKIRPVARGGHARGIGGDGRFEIVYGFLRELSIGDVALRSVPVYIRKFHTDAKQVDGYIGLAVISKFLTTIDYGDKTFALAKRSGGQKERGPNDELALPLRLTGSGFLSGEVFLEGVESPLNFIVDTGASVSVISQQVASVDTVSQFASDETLRVIGSAGITNNVPTFLLPRVSFGKNSRRDIMAIALDLNIINETSGFEQSGILGGNFLKNYRLTFDFGNARVTFVSILPEN